MKDEIELLPCPFCGGNNIGVRNVEAYSVDSSYCVFGCGDCEIGIELPYEYTEDQKNESTNEWNARPEPVKRVDVEELVDRCEKIIIDSCLISDKSQWILNVDIEPYDISQALVNHILQKSRPDGRVIEEVLEIIKNEHTYYRDQCDGYRALSWAMDKIKSKLTKGGG